MQGRRRELIPYQVRVAVRDTCGGWGLYTVSEIGELFIGHGFQPTTGEFPSAGGQRRTEVESFHAAIDWTDPEQVEHYLRLIEEILDDHDNDDGRDRRDRLVRVLVRAGFEIDERGRVRLPPPPPSATLDQSVLPNESDIRLHLDRLGRLDQEPEEMIGAAKELIEATAKYVLLTLDVPIDPNADIGELSKAALAELHLRPESLAPTSKGVDSMKRILGGLGQIAAGMAELRNQYGTGHGRGTRVGGLQARHAEFAARAAVAYAAFVLDTLADPAAPWRP
jgi:hypothetical protein